MIGFIGLFDAARGYTLQYTVTHTHTSAHSHVFTAVAWQRLSTADFPLPQGSRTVPGHSYQLLTATAHND
jgi:hypothetical protein